jgi:hypothetical protein
MCKYSYPSSATGVLGNPSVDKAKALSEIDRKEIAVVKVAVPGFDTKSTRNMLKIKLVIKSWHEFNAIIKQLPANAGILVWKLAIFSAHTLHM